MRRAALWLADIAVVLSGVSLVGQTGPTTADTSAVKPAEVSFQFDRTGLPVPHFTLRVWEDGSGAYQAKQVEIPASATSMRGQAAQTIDRTINLSQGTVLKIFKAARGMNYFNIECASKMKNIADTGKKVLSYAGVDGSGSCTYNFSENKTVVMLTDMFLALANTMDEGRKLEFLHRYDRLGLDAEMTFLSQEVESGRALDIGSISPTLAAIAADSEVIQRVRLRAQKMVEQAAEQGH
jgi:hypothetical protein